MTAPLLDIVPGFPPGLRAPRADDPPRAAAAMATANAAALRHAAVALEQVLGRRIVEAIDVDGERRQPFVERFPTSWWDAISISARLLRIAEAQSVLDGDDGRVRLVAGGAFGALDQSSYMTSPGAHRDHADRRLEPAAVAAALADGAVLNVNYLEDSDVAVRRVAEMVGRLSRASINVNLYVSRDGTSGTGPHWDDHDVIIIQVAGSKEWRVAEPTDPAPTKEGPLNRTAGPQCIHETLHSGEAMFIPRGYWHEATSTGELSLHLTVSISRPTSRHLLDYLARAVVDDAEQRADLRSDDVGRVASLVGDGTSEQLLDELWAALGATRVAATGTRIDLLSNLLTIPSWLGIGLHVRVPVPGPVAIAPTTGDGVRVAVGAHTISATDETVQLLAQMCCGDACALDALSLLPAAEDVDISALARELVLAGLADVYVGDEPDWALVSGILPSGGADR